MNPPLINTPRVRVQLDAGWYRIYRKGREVGGTPGNELGRLLACDLAVCILEGRKR